MRFASILSAAVLATALDSSVNPNTVAEGVHQRGGYGSELDIAEGTSGDGLVVSTDDLVTGKGRESPTGPGQGWRQDGWGDDPRESVRHPPSAPSPSPSAPVRIGTMFSQGVLLAVLAALVLLLGWILSRFLGGRRQPESSVQIPGGHKQAEVSRDLSLDPDELAREQRLGEAIELLLLQSLRRVGWLPRSDDDSLTARDVAAGLSRRDPRYAPLHQIVVLAEAVRFGGAEPSLERYQRMRRHFAELRAASGPVEAT